MFPELGHLRGLSSHKQNRISFVRDYFGGANEPPAVRRDRIRVSPDGIISEDGTFAYKQQRKIRIMMMMVMVGYSSDAVGQQRGGRKQQEQEITLQLKYGIGVRLKLLSN